MNTKQILKAVDLPATKERLAHASALSEILKMVATLNIIDVQMDDGGMWFGRKTEKRWRYNEFETVVRNEGDEIKCKKVTILAATGTYSISVPLPLMSEFMAAIGLKYASTEAINVVSTVNCGLDISPLIKKAARFVSKDKLRPNMQFVCLHFKGDGLKVVATDAHKLYVSNWVGCYRDNSEEKKVLISGDYSAVKDANKIETLDDGSLLIGGVKFTVEDHNFVDYERVIPAYSTYMDFNKKEFVKTVKCALNGANKTTHQLKFHLNGQIDVSAEDFDFGNESKFGMPYIDKTFTDTDISFNGKFLIDCLSAIDGEKVRMYSEGSNSRAVMFNENVLLMPIQI